MTSDSPSKKQRKNNEDDDDVYESSEEDFSDEEYYKTKRISKKKKSKIYNRHKDSSDDEDDDEEEEEDNSDELHDSDASNRFTTDTEDCYNYDGGYGYSSSEEEDDTGELDKKVKSEVENVDSVVIEIGGIVLKFPIKILFDILGRLPIKSVSSCRSVCKGFAAAVKNRSFVEMYHDKVMKKNSPCVIFLDIDFREKYHFLINHEDLELRKTELPRYLAQLPRPLPEMASCNGLIFSHRQPYFICNPITGEHMVLPRPEFGSKDTVTGFGFDVVSKVFKVIRIMEDEEEMFASNTYLEVFNFSSGKWSFKHGVHCSFDTTANVYFNGSLHWIGSPRVIISFNLHTEEFQQIPLPRVINSGSSTSEPYLVVLQTSLCVIRTVTKEHIEIWAMKEYTSQPIWGKIFTIQDIKMEGEVVKGPYKPIRWLGGEILLSCSDTELGYYNHVTKRIRLVELHVDMIKNPLVHVGSLISPETVGKLKKR
ncbi:hypothetical protein ACHQM5_008340 [Ranunculus cassubicifolius]